MIVSREDTKETRQIAVRVLFFGAARDAVGQSDVAFLLNSPANAATAFEQVLEVFPALRRFGRSLLFAINEEYAPADREVCEGDELAVFPPVSGGSGRDGEMGRRGEMETRRKGDTGKRGDAGTGGVLQAAVRESNATLNDFFELTTDPIDVGAVARRVVLAECGATITLDGYAREWTNGRKTLSLVYEAYLSMALSEMRRLGREAHERFAIAHIGIVHRTGKLEIGETSVVIAVSAPHRRAAFEACEWAIRELKRKVPIWKKEIFEDGEVWVESEGSQMSRVSNIVGEIGEQLQNNYHEDSLREFLEEKLTMLREAYREDPRQFTQEQQDFLRDVSTRTLLAIRQFIEMSSELVDVQSLEEFYFLKSKLKTIHDELDGLAVSRRIDKEIRDLIQKRLSIQDVDATNHQFRINMRVHELNQNATLCDRGHKMELRQGRYGYFWGCTAYPYCTSWRSLTPSQESSLKQS